MSLPEGLVTGKTLRLPGDHLPQPEAKPSNPFTRKRFAAGRTVRHAPGTMNKTEAAYAAHLQTLVHAGEIVAYWFEPMKLRLATLTHYTPDFVVLHNDGMLEFAEVKGGMIEDDAMVKFKVAAETYWMFKFCMYQRKRVKDPFTQIRGEVSLETGATK